MRASVTRALLGLSVGQSIVWRRDVCLRVSAVHDKPALSALT